MIARRVSSDVVDTYTSPDAASAATTLQDLRLPPSNQLEALKKDRKGQHSVRINDQWRICFVWQRGYAEHVEIVDYH